MEHPVGPAFRSEPQHREPHLACLRAATPPHRDLQAVGGPPLHREGAGYCGALSTRRTGRWSCAWTGPHQAAFAPASGPRHAGGVAAVVAHRAHPPGEGGFSPSGPELPDQLTWWRPTASCAGACIRAAPNWRLPSTATWTSPTLRGPRPLSPAFVVGML